MYKIEYTREFFHDLENIYNYIALDSLYYARKTIKEIYERIDTLRHSPYMWRKVPELDLNSIREIIYKSYRIIFEINDICKTVILQTIIHGKRDFNSTYHYKI